MKIGYAGVSTLEQNLDLQLQARNLNPERTKPAQRLLEEGKAVREVAETFNVHGAMIYRVSAVGAYGLPTIRPGQGRRPVAGWYHGRDALGPNDPHQRKPVYEQRISTTVNPIHPAVRRYDLRGPWIGINLIRE